MRSRCTENISYMYAVYCKAIKSCTSHYIREDKLTELVLAEIQSLVMNYKESPKTFTKKIQKKLNTEGTFNTKQTQKKLSEIAERIAEIKVYIQHLFEEKVKGNITYMPICLRSIPMKKPNC